MLNSDQKKIKLILLEIEKYQSNLRKRIHKRDKQLYYGFIGISAISFIFSLVLIISGAFFKNQDLIVLAFILIFVSEISLLISTLVDIYQSRKNLHSFIKKPEFQLLNNTETNTRSKIKFLPKLLKFNLDDLELSKLEITYEKEHFDRRTSIITGTIDKIGIFPTILATFILIQTQLSNIHVQNFLKTHPNFQFYFYALIFIVVLFQITSVFNNFTSLKLQNMINALDYAIKKKKDG